MASLSAWMAMCEVPRPGLITVDQHACASTYDHVSVNGIVQQGAILDANWVWVDTIQPGIRGLQSSPAGAASSHGVGEDGSRRKLGSMGEKFISDGDLSILILKCHFCCSDLEFALLCYTPDSDVECIHELTWELFLYPLRDIRLGL